MTRLTTNDAWCEALFASGLQRSDAPAPEALAGVIGRTVRRFGITGCAGRMAQEFGDHPEAAASRMRWIRQLLTEIPAPGRLTDHQAQQEAADPRLRVARHAASDWQGPPRGPTLHV
jgi:hypothetical protein